MMQTDNSYFDENSLVSQPPPPPEKKKPWLTISILANILLLLATIGSVIMWMNAKKQVTQLTNDNNMLRGQIASGSMPMVPMSGGNQNNCGLDRFRGSDLGLVAVFYNNLGEEIPLKVATAGGNKTASLVLSPDSHYQVDHLERLSFSANGKNSSTAALCIDIPRTALPPGECVKGNETCER